MKKIILLLILSTSLTARAQTLETTKDPFNGKVIKNGTATIGGPIAPFAKLTLRFTKNGDNKFISFRWRSGTAALGSLNDKSRDVSLLFKLENDSVYRFKVDTIYGEPGTEERSMLVMRAKISNEAVFAFASSMVANFRIGLKEDNGIDLDGKLLSLKNKYQIQSAAAYIIDMKVLPPDDDEQK